MRTGSVLSSPKPTTFDENKTTSIVSDRALKLRSLENLATVCSIAFRVKSNSFAHDLVSFDLAVERRTLHAENLSGFALVPACLS